MTTHQKPKARDEDIVIQEVLDELLIYDKQRHQLYALNPIVAWLWQRLDGQADTQELAGHLSQQFPELAGQAEHLLWATLQRLDEKHLLAQRVREQIPPQLETRRTMLKRMGLALALLPVVTTLAAPSPAQAQTLSPLCTGCFTSQAEAENACGASTVGTCWTNNSCGGSNPGTEPNLTPSSCFAFSSAGSWRAPTTP